MYQHLQVGVPKWVFPKIGKHPKMDGEKNGKPLSKWMIWGYHYFWKQPNGSVTGCLPSPVLRVFSWQPDWKVQVQAGRLTAGFT